MGSVCGRLTALSAPRPSIVAAPEPAPVSYISHRCEKTFDIFPWGQNIWICEECSANWEIHDVSRISRGTYELAVHSGGEPRSWNWGSPGICKCGVLWTPIGQ